MPSVSALASAALTATDQALSVTAVVKISLTWPEPSRIWTVIVCPLVTPAALPVMSKPALALLALIMSTSAVLFMSAALAFSPAMVLIATVVVGGVMLAGFTIGIVAGVTGATIIPGLAAGLITGPSWS